MESEAEYWLDLGRRLGVEVVAPFELEVGSLRVHFTALLPQFGAPRGMIVDSDMDSLWAHRKTLDEAGYGFSCVEGSGPADFDVEREMLSDWGWNSESPKPDWIQS